MLERDGEGKACREMGGRGGEGTAGEGGRESL